MEFFNEDFEKEKNSIDEENKKKYIEMYSKQIKLSRTIITIIFGVIGVFSLIVGFAMISQNETEGAIGFLSMGGVFLFLAILFFIIFSCVKVNEQSFERQKSRFARYGQMHPALINSTLDTHEEKLIELEARIEELEAELEHLKRQK